MEGSRRTGRTMNILTEQLQKLQCLLMFASTRHGKHMVSVRPALSEDLQFSTHACNINTAQVELQ